MDADSPPPPGPAEVHDPLVRETFKRASVWLGLGAALFLLWQLALPILLIIGGLVFAAMLDGGTQALGRVWRGPRGARLTIVVILILGVVLASLAWGGWQLGAQAEELSATLTEQLQRLSRFLEARGIADIVGNESGKGPLVEIAQQLFGSVGRLTQVVGGAVGAIGSLILILVLGLFIAAEPRLYERGIEWLTPVRARPKLRETLDEMALMMRRWTAGRLFAMVVDGALTAFGLMLFGVPLWGILGLLAALLAFIPNIGAFVAGTLIVLVGFSAGTETGIAALGVYLVVQFIEGYVLTPFVERRAVDLAPATTLCAQLLFGALFGVLGVALADPIVAMIKVALGHRQKQG